jgi:hypothetical protein
MSQYTDLQQEYRKGEFDYPLWYQSRPPWGKWHLVGNKCYKEDDFWLRYGSDAEKARSQERWDAERQRERETTLEPTMLKDKPDWSNVPLPSKYISKLCKRCVRKAPSLINHGAV